MHSVVDCAHRLEQVRQVVSKIRSLQLTLTAATDNQTDSQQQLQGFTAATAGGFSNVGLGVALGSLCGTAGVTVSER